MELLQTTQQKEYVTKNKPLKDLRPQTTVLPEEIHIYIFVPQIFPTGNVIQTFLTNILCIHAQIRVFLHF